MVCGVGLATRWWVAILPAGEQQCYLLISLLFTLSFLSLVLRLYGGHMKINVEQVRLKTELLGLPLHMRGQRFLKGPIPVPWISRASELPGKALQVATALWYVAGLTKSRVVRLAPSLLEEFGVKRSAWHRALRLLESAELVSVERRGYRRAVITLLDYQPQKSSEKE